MADAKMLLPSLNLEYDEFGDARQVLKCRSRGVRRRLENSEVRVRWLASPIDPLDINKMEGAYPFKLQFPVVAGSEGVGRVEAVGEAVHDLRPGDTVIPYLGVFGVWCERSIHQREELIEVDRRLDLESAATLLINPPTAYVMLKEYVALNSGDWIIQNAANSGVGRDVIQLAKAFGYRSINLVRDRPDLPRLVAELRDLGADHVFTEEQFRSWATNEISSNRPKLALNGVGGRSALIISSVLDHGSTMITYGGMSKRPTEVTTASFIFRGLQVVGIAISEWMMRQENKEKKVTMFNELQKLILDGKLRPPPMKKWPLGDYRKALERHLDGGHGKQLLILDSSIIESSKY